MVERLRNDPGALGLVSGVGMHMTKHVFGCYSTTPGPLVPPEPVATLPATEVVASNEGDGHRRELLGSTRPRRRTGMGVACL